MLIGLLLSMSVVYDRWQHADALAAEQAQLEAIIATAGTDSEHQLEIAADALRVAIQNDLGWRVRVPEFGEQVTI